MRVIVPTSLAAALVAGSASLALTLSAQAPRQVDDATLLKPPDGDWVTYGRDYHETHHSPLKQIDQSNVSRFGVAWSVEVGSQGKIETTPIIWDGMLFGTSTWSVVYAVDIRTGTLKWKWDPGLVKGGFSQRRPALLLRARESRRRHLQGPGLRRAARRPPGRARRPDRSIVWPCRPRPPAATTPSPARPASSRARCSSAMAAASTACAATSPPTTPTPASRSGAGTSSPAIPR